jgi:two-component system NtrC family response regulator
MSQNSVPPPVNPESLLQADRSKRVIVVSDDDGFRATVRGLFPELDVQFFRRLAPAVDIAAALVPDVVLFDVDLALGDAGGIQAAIGHFLRLSPSIKVIAVVAEGQREHASSALQSGASDFYHLPVEPVVLPMLVRRALRVRELEQENQALRGAQPIETSGSGILGRSAAMQSVLRIVEKVSGTDATVVLLGESGSGKELVARALHRQSLRSAQPFCAINCAAIPETLLESELFGHERGAFTGAVRQSLGRFELAAGGTVFLDEIGEMPLVLQAKLLRVVQERVIERVGGRVGIPIDIRIVCATHRDLPALVAAQAFREDLFYRLSQMTIRIPPLRERDGDVTLLARFFLRESVRRHSSRVCGFAPDAMEAMHRYHWPGNVRELQNRVETAVIMADGAWIGALELGLEGTVGGADFSLRHARSAAERKALDRALAVASGNLSRASALLGVSRPTLYDLLSKHAMRATDFVVG